MKRFVNIFPMSLFCFFNFLLNDAIDFLMNTEDNSDIESSSDEDDHYQAMLPSTEKVDTKKSRNQLQETGKKALQPTLKLPEASAVSE